MLDALARIIPEDRLLVDQALRGVYQSDGLTAFAEQPKAVVIPETAEEVIATVNWCREHEVPFVARGSGTSLSGGSLPIKEGIVITLNRMNRILALDPENMIAVVEPGVINLAVSQAAAPHGLYFAPDPSSQQICTIGGNIAFNSGGAHCLKYGMTSNHVIGLKAVLATGEIIDTGGPSLEQCGPDTTALFVGSEGLFGIALEITLRLLPRPEVFHTVLAAYDSVEAAGDAVSAVVASGLLPGAMEIMDRLAIDAAEAAVQAGYPADATAVLIVELEGPRDEVALEKQQLDDLLNRSGATAIQVAATDAERAIIWKGRKSAFSAVGRLSPDFLVQDGVVPRSRLGEALRHIGAMSKAAGLRVANVFHAGDGNLHPLILFDNRVPGDLERAEELAADILRMCTRMGGSLTGEHGIGVEKRDLMPDMFSAEDIEFQQALRRVYDPREIANPGKMFPGSEAPALKQHGLHPLEKAGVISRE